MSEDTQELAHHVWLCNAQDAYIPVVWTFQYRQENHDFNPYYVLFYLLTFGSWRGCSIRREASRECAELLSVLHLPNDIEAAKEYARLLTKEETGKR